MKKFDVVVIGLGAVGSAALYELSKTGLSVAGIDKYAPPHGHGSSFGESRVTRQAIGEGDYYVPLLKRADELWNDLERTTGETLYNHCGMLIAGYEKQIFMQNTLKAAADFSIEHKVLNGKEVEHLFPAMQTANSDHMFYYEPSSGYLLPEKCISVQLRLARDNGATALLNTSVTAIEENESGIHIALDGGESIIAQKVIVSSGPWINELLPHILEPILKMYLQAIYWFDVDREHANELKPGHLPVFLCGFENAERTRAFSGFPMTAGQTGGIKFTMDESDVEISPDAKDGVKLDGKAAHELYSQVSRYFKYVKPEVLRSFNCVYTATPDWDFILDFAPGSERIIIGSACSSHGFKYAAASGEALAQLAVDGKSVQGTNAFSIARFINKTV